MAALHLAMGDWNLQHGSSGRRLHVLAPAEIRPPEWDEEPIANFSVDLWFSTPARSPLTLCLGRSR